MEDRITGTSFKGGPAEGDAAEGRIPQGGLVEGVSVFVHVPVIDPNLAIIQEHPPEDTMVVPGEQQVLGHMAEEMRGRVTAIIGEGSSLMIFEGSRWSSSW